MSQFTNFRGRIIWSADNVSLMCLLRKVSKSNFPRDQVAIKLDRLFVEKNGLDAIRQIQAEGVPVFDDAKIVEIPSKVMEITKLHLENQPFMLNVGSSIISTGIYDPAKVTPKLQLDALAQFADLCREAGTRSCMVTVLTSKTSKMVDYEFQRSLDSVIYDYVDLANSCGITDIVCAPTDLVYLQEHVKSGKWKVKFDTPGVRLAGGDTHDQQRFDTPGKAIKNGASRLVIGRALSEGDFYANLAKILADIEAENPS